MSTPKIGLQTKINFFHVWVKARCGQGLARSRQSQGKVKERLRQGQGNVKVKERFKQGKSKVKARLRDKDKARSM